MKFQIVLIIFLITSLFTCGQKEIRSDEVLHEHASQKTDSVAKAEFDLDGYYYSKDTLRYKQFELITLDIYIMDYRKKGNKFIELPKDSVFIALNFHNSVSHKDIKIRTKDFLIKKDTLQLTFQDKQIGEIKIFGQFTGNKGPYYDNVEVLKTIVLKASIIFKDTTIATNFTWWEGD